MISYFRIIIVSIVAAFYSACSNTGRSPDNNSTGMGADSIVIYGGGDCGYCEDLLDDLDEYDLNYKFLDVYDSTNSYQKELKKELKKYNYSGTIELPIVVLKDTLLARPDIEDILNQLEEE